MLISRRTSRHNDTPVVAGDVTHLVSLDSVKDLPIFRNCDAKFVEDITAHFKVEVFQPGQIVLLEGVGNPSLRIVRRGLVEVLLQGRYTRQLEEGDLHGEAQILGVRRQAPETLKAKTVVEVLVLSRKVLVQILVRHPHERVIFQHLAVSYKLELLRMQVKRHEQTDDRTMEKLRQLEVQHAQLEQIIGLGHKSARSIATDSPIDALLGPGASETPAGDSSAVAGRATPRLRRMVFEQNTQPGCWQSLADWHKQLATSSEAHRLNLWQLEYYRGSSAQPLAALPRCASRASGTASRCSNVRKQTPPALPPRPHSVAGTMPLLQQPPYPSMPKPPPRDPACLRKGGKARTPMRNIARGRRCKASCGKPHGGDTGVEANADASQWWSMSIGEEPLLSVQESTMSALPDGPGTALTPGLCEAIGDLSRGVLRSQWHCENLGRTSPGASPRESSAIPQSTVSTNPVQTSAASSSLAFREFRALSNPRSQTPNGPLTPARRLEVTLRGAFRTSETNYEANDAVDRDDIESGTNPRAASTTSRWSDSEEALRARMGFGRDEGGATPSGRSSVPAIRGGALSAPPLAHAIDEGIDLSSLIDSVEYHILRILERSLRGPSRATSCEPTPRSPSPSPTPPTMTWQSCPSPSPRGTVEDLTLRVVLRLCQSRCGSSSAVLELLLDHSADCSEACGCRCWPSPEDAETRLLTHFARHSMLRVASTQPPVKVLLEPLDGDDMTRAS
jgi:CRP-like cAMP-binding protein